MRLTIPLSSSDPNQNIFNVAELRLQHQINLIGNLEENVPENNAINMDSDESDAEMEDQKDQNEIVEKKTKKSRGKRKTNNPEHFYDLDDDFIDDTALYVEAGGVDSLKELPHESEFGFFVWKGPLESLFRNPHIATLPKKTQPTVSSAIVTSGAIPNSINSTPKPSTVADKILKPKKDSVKVSDHPKTVKKGSIQHHQSTPLPKNLKTVSNASKSSAKKNSGATLIDSPLISVSETSSNKNNIPTPSASSLPISISSADSLDLPVNLIIFIISHYVKR